MGNFRAAQGERGVTVVIFAISITALLAVASLVLGGSTGYSASRNAQTSADSAALAATTTLRQQKVVLLDAGIPNFAAVLATATSVAEDNGATLRSCDLIQTAYAVGYANSYVVAPCDSATQAQFVSAAGVRVRVEETREVPFGQFVESEEISASAVAAATVQPVRGAMRAPFMLCSKAEDHGVPLVLDDPTKYPPYRINDAATGDIEILLWANGNGFGNRNCGVSPWHGLVNTDLVFSVPSDPDDPETWWDIDTGSRVGHIPRLLAADDACNWDDATDEDIDAWEGCELALPLCVEADGTGTNAALNCVRMAVFEITYVGDGQELGSCASIDKKVVCGRIKPGGGLATAGQGVLDEADPHELVVIKLVQ